MTLRIHKYHGTGNDFLLIRDTGKSFPENDFSMIARLCHRRFGIGADGLMLLRPSVDADFRMVYFNSDGRHGSMCGNGGRCMVAFAHREGLLQGRRDVTFEASDGMHRAKVLSEDRNVVRVALGLNAPTSIENTAEGWFLNTGSPHLVRFVKSAAQTDVVGEGRKLRYDPLFAPGGTNVNFVELREEGLFVRTYERGVEDETLSCGTGVTASALAAFFHKKCGSLCRIETPGGMLEVSIEEREGKIDSLILSGPAEYVFQTDISI